MYELKFTEKTQYLHVTVYGDLDSTTDLTIDADIRQECETRNLDFVLIDIRPMTSRLTYIENHNAAKSFRERMGFNIRAIAIVDTVNFDEKSEMYELTATNRGAIVKFFKKDEDAANWLLSNSK